MKVQRLRVTFSRGEELKYITHLDMMRFWERALRRAGIPMSYSEGFSPHPQIALAAPLAVGVTGESELLDVFLERAMKPADFIEAVAPQLPAGIAVTRAEEVGLALPSMQAELKAAEYIVAVAQPEPTARDAVAHFMAQQHVPWEHQREDQVRSYDIREMVYEMDVAASDEAATSLRMLLKSDSSGSGRPEQVALALGLGQPVRIHRRRLVLASASRARTAWRTRGRFAE